MSRHELSAKAKANYAVDELLCTNCGGSLEAVGNRLFMMYKRARLPQPKTEALVCAHCGWVEGDDSFKALLEERIGQK